MVVKATEEQRLLPGTQSAEILGVVENRIKEAYAFRLIDKESGQRGDYG